jgi:L-ascorbate metabolism protein UlaG (beta-lactamase superfamily)
MSRRLVKLAAAATAAIVAERKLIAAPRYRGPLSDHFDGHRFHNHQDGWQSEGSFLKWQATKTPTKWPEWIDGAPGPKPPARVDGESLRVTFVNHSTFLVQTAGLNLLTDPIWRERCSPVQFAGPKRHRPPGLRFEDLPPIDAVLVSHNHYDHMDVATLRKLRGVRVYAPLGSAALLARNRVWNSVDMDWWDSVHIDDDVTLTCVPSQHFCARGLSDRNATLWSGFVISTPHGQIYFAGDTGWGAHFEQIHERFGAMRLAMLPIGSYLPRWFMKPAHIDPAEAVDAHFVLRAKTSIAIHYGTFALGDDGAEEPLDDLRNALDARPCNFVALDHGAGYEVS